MDVLHISGTVLRMEQTTSVVPATGLDSDLLQPAAGEPHGCSIGVLHLGILR